MAQPNADLIAAAPILLADLCDEVEHLRSALGYAARDAQTGPDGQNYLDRARLIAAWLREVDEHDGELLGVTSWDEVERAVTDGVDHPLPTFPEPLAVPDTIRQHVPEAEGAA